MTTALPLPNVHTSPPRSLPMETNPVILDPEIRALECHILMIEDSEADQSAFLRYIKRNQLRLRVEIVESVKAAKAVLLEKQYDLVLLDYQLKDGTAYHLIEYIRNTPVIMTTGLSEISVAIDLLKQGVADYLVKDLNYHYLDQLPKTILNTIRNHELQKLVKKQQQEITLRNSALEMQLELAQRVQSALIHTELPYCDWLEIDIQYKPCDLIGGDYYSIAPLNEGGMSVFIGDIAGYGIVASLFLSLLKATTNQVSRNHGMLPKQYLKELNNELVHNMPDSFLTAIYGLFRKNEDGYLTFTFANAAHPFPIYYQAATQQYVPLRSAGYFLGIFDRIHVQEITTVLHPGDRLFVYTDGIMDRATTEGSILDLDRFLAIFEHSTRPTLKATLQVVMDEVKGTGVTESDPDDMLLIGFEVK